MLVLMVFFPSNFFFFTFNWVSTIWLMLIWSCRWVCFVLILIWFCILCWVSFYSGLTDLHRIWTTAGHKLWLWWDKWLVWFDGLSLSLSLSLNLTPRFLSPLPSSWWIRFGFFWSTLDCSVRITNERLINVLIWQLWLVYRINWPI